ncbi:hypothetical protein L5515_000390 [Caenorhabditis briggsae]|uniref:UBR-type domain-containing protein n=1 Tax=Caenorhabditis briggsae TaxID=6238 RepID=A0AAE9J281_CAEBR|nr:hypothetical protein L5515_000390 [Caenorhabditis briggsae]
MGARDLALGLARWVIKNGENEISGDLTAAIVYRLRVVENYHHTDVDVICEAMRLLIKQLVKLPPVTFAPEVWIPILTAIIEGGIEPLWSDMMITIDLSHIATSSAPDENLDDVDSELPPNSGLKTCEQITTISREAVLEIGLPRRVFSAIWGCDFGELMEKMMGGSWEDIKISTTNESAKQASWLLERNIFDTFSEMSNYEQFAKEIYYAALARLLKRLQEDQKPSKDAEDASHYDMSFQIYEEVIKKLWPYLTKKDLDATKKSTLTIFEKLLSTAPNDNLVQKIAEKFIDTCGWLKISAEQICAEMEPRLWRTVKSLVARLLDLKKTIPYEIVSYAIAVHITQEVTLASPEEFAPDDFETIALQPTAGSKKEMYLRTMVDATRVSLWSCIKFLKTAKSSEDIVHFMKTFYSDLVFSQEAAIIEAAVDLYREATSHDLIKSEDILSIVDCVINAPAIVSIMFIIDRIKDSKTIEIAIERVLIRMANDLEDIDEKREGYVNHMNETAEFWQCVRGMATWEITNRAAKRFAEVAIDSVDIRTATLAADFFLTILTLELEDDSKTKKPSICNANFPSWQMETDRFQQIGNKLVECNMAKRDASKRCPLFTLKQLEDVEGLTPRELIYVATQMKTLKTPEGLGRHQKFYEGYEGIEGILEKFQSREHQIRICQKLLENFCTTIMENEKSSLFFLMDSENILTWLEEIGVLHTLTENLVELCFTIEAWDMMTLLQLDPNEVHFEELQIFGKIWNSKVWKTLDEERQKEMEEQTRLLLRKQYEVQNHKMKAYREKRYNGKFPIRPKTEQFETKLLEMHNRIATWLVAKKTAKEFADESTKMYTWLLGVCSGQTSYEKDVGVAALNILVRLHPDKEKRDGILHHFGVKTALRGSCKCAEKKDFISFRRFFLRIFNEIVATDMKQWTNDLPIEKVNHRLGGFLEWLDDFSDDVRATDFGTHIQSILHLAHHCWFRLRTIEVAELDGTTPEAISVASKKFVEFIAGHMDKIVRWMEPNVKPFNYSSRFEQFLEVIFTFPDLAKEHRQTIELFLEQIFDLFLREDCIQGLINHPDYKVQTTEKYGNSSLNTLNEYYLKDPVHGKLFRIQTILELICSYGTENVHLYCLARIQEAVRTIPAKILENSGILSGDTIIVENSQKRIIPDVTILTEFIGFFNCLYQQLCIEPPVEPTDDTVIRAFLLQDSDIRARNDSVKKNGHAEKGHHKNELDFNFCTFKSTGNKFVTQHWYNCYTCKMIESTGVCSTCAINCHRGHELAYSKKGAFFCDCGSNGCESMIIQVEHVPHSINALRGQIPDGMVQKASPKNPNIFPYKFGFFKPEFSKFSNSGFETVKNAVRLVQEEFEKAHESIEKILEAIDKGNQKALRVTEKREKIVKSMRNMERVELEENEEFMEALDSAGHFLPIRRSDIRIHDTHNSSALPRQRELADVIKLDNGTELLVMIPDSIQTSLHLHYMDTRTHLLQGMHFLRTETEQIPFNAVSLHVSGNRVVVCGVYEIYALRFSPQGTVIDRAHIKLLENGNSSSMQNNPVRKAMFCEETRGDKKKRQLIAVATMQYIRVYDLTLHDSDFVEEMVLTTGNVEDVVILNQDNGNIRILVLASSGYLYEHNITDCSADNNSIFLTNVVNTPGMDMNGDGVSLHYSSTFDLLFVSLDTALYVARLPDAGSPPIYDWKLLNIKWPVEVWRESAGLISCLSKEISDQVIYFLPQEDKILIQKTHVKRPISTYFLLTSSKKQAIYSCLLFADLPTCEIWETTWQLTHDLWIEDVPSERFAVEIVDTQGATPRPLDKRDAVLMAEQIEPIGSVDWSCREIEAFYTHDELNHRMAAVQENCMPITVVQQTHFTLLARITNSRQIVRMIRVEVEGPTGPDFLKIGGTRYSINSREHKAFDLRLSREESLNMDHREISIEVIPKSTQNTIKIRSLKLYGCDRDQMDEVQPRFERQPVLSTSNRLVFAVLGFPGLEKKWAERQAKKHLSRKLNHPMVYGAALRAIIRANSPGNLDENLFRIIDSAYLQEWKALPEWTDAVGFHEMRTNYIEQLLIRLQAVRTRWAFFYKTLKHEFNGSVTKFVEIMIEEMKRMPLHRCSMIAQAIVKVVFGLLSHTTADDSEHLIQIFLDIFTDQPTYHLANDMRSAVQETITRYENSMKKQAKTLEIFHHRIGYRVTRVAESGIGQFYGCPKIVEESSDSVLISQINGIKQSYEADDTQWLQLLINMVLNKLTRSKSTTTWQNISDSPSYNLSRVLASCVAILDSKVVANHFTHLVSLIKYDADQIYPFTEESYANYSLLRSVELLLFVCLEKRCEAGCECSEAITERLLKELQSVGIRDLCFKVLEKLIPEWKGRGPATITRSSTVEGGHQRKVWLPHVPLVSSSANPPNAAVLKSSDWPSNSNDAYIISCTDLVLLIPQHLHELDRKKSIPRDDRWFQKLCQLMTYSIGCSAYRQSKKLLMAMCNGDETKYKIMRDKYKMQDLLQQLVRKYVDVSKEIGGHQQLTEIVDILAAITKLALARPDMWSDVASTYTTWLLRLACYTADVVASQVVELLIVAVRDSSVGGQLSIQLADSIIEAENGEFIEKIIKRFLIGKDEQLRWTLHGMLRSVIQLASRQNQCSIVKKLYNMMYPLVANLGVQGAQLVDLIATYAPRVFSSSELVSMTQSEISTIQKLSNLLNEEGYRGNYRLMSELGLGWKAIQFDRNPCLVCFQTKGSHDVVKMTSMRQDARYSPNTMIYKLISNYEISKVTIKLSDVKRTKTIKKVSLYYSAKSVESVELKLHPDLWRKCAMVTVPDNEICINLALAVPVVTSSLVIEFEEVADQRGISQLHCPRCSGPVRSQSGVCDGCGENAFQCVKCRAINYVEREPFLCQSCGYCKYARIDVLATCRALPGAQHITCDAERGQCIQEITQLLVKMDTTRTKLTGYRAVCESLYLKPRPLPAYRLHVENTHIAEFFEANGSVNTEQQPFQSVTQPMANLSNSIKNLHGELCQQTQQLMYLHEELNRYDHSNEISVVCYKPQNSSYYSTSESCFGCLCNQLLHSIALLHSSCDDENALNLLLSSDSVIEKLGCLGQTYEPLREEIEELIVRLMFNRSDMTTKIQKLIESGDVNLSVMVKSLMYAADPTWQQKLKLLIRFAIEKRDENSCLQALMVLNKYLEATKSVTVEERRRSRMSGKESVVRWLTSDDDWKDCCSIASTSHTKAPPTPSNPYQWISECLFSQWMSVRSAANQLLVSLSRQSFHEPISFLILCENIPKLGEMPSRSCDQFMASCHTIIDSSANTKTRLFIQQFHVYLIRRIHEECANLHEQSISLLTDNSFGERLRCFVELLSLLLSGSNVENVLLKAGADDLLIFLLHSTIFLKRMMTRRTRAIDSSRIALEKLLKRVSSRDGTKLMSVCVESLKLVKDTSTLGIIVGVMMEIMNPQQQQEESFYIQIEKDVAQEDFLQGRMANNPYSSSDPGMGPLMRDIKNKICRDTEMIALMEDDNGMELLVGGNIISLSLSVRDVYDRLWKRNNIGAPMLIVYRMRGLMGDAVETFIENFGVAEDSNEDAEEDEQLAKMTSCLTKCGGIDKLMDLLATSVDSSSGRFLLGHLRKIFERIVKIPSGRRALIERQMPERMFSVVRICCADPTNESKVQIGLELYKVVEFVVSDKQVQDILGGIQKEDATWWFDLFEKRGNEEGSVTEMHRKTAQLLDQMTASIGNVVLGSHDSEDVLVEMYKRILKWEVIDAGVTAAEQRARVTISRRDQTIMMTEQLATITSNLLQSTYGIRLKQKILDSGVIDSTCQYLLKDLPNLYQPTESPEWKVFLSKPSLKLILTLLAGLARGHQASQKEIAKTSLKLMHRLEQVASDNSIGTLAENVIEALNEDEEVKNQIKMVRDETEKKKKQLAMANREKQLQKMRMKVGSGGQITVSSRTIHNEPSIDDTDSLTCCICRESVIRGTQAAGVYAFAAVDPETARTSTVSMMVMVHLECHKNAIRGGGGGRAVDEWTRSKLHNAGAKCNVITPIAMGNCSNENWMEALQRFATDIGRISGLAHGVINRNFVFVDICRLIDRFIYKRSFSNQSDGGGRESNMQYLSILHLLGVSLGTGDVEFEISNPMQRLVAFLFTELTAESWNEQKNDVLRATLNDAQTNGVEATWQGFKPTLMTWALVDAYFNKIIKITGEDRIEWLREHLVENINKTRGFVEDFDSNVLPCDDINEFCDVTGAPLEELNMFLAGNQP